MPAENTNAQRRKSDAVLADLAASLADELGLHETLSCVVRCAAELLDARQVTVGVCRGDNKPGWTDVLQVESGNPEHAAIGAELLLDELSRLALPHRCELFGRGVLALPIVAAELQLGVLAIVPAVDIVEPLDPEIHRALQVICLHAGLAIRNAMRMARERRRLARLQLVANVGQLINRGGNPLMTTLQLAADAIHEVLEYPNVDIPLVDADDPTVLVIAVRGGGYKRIHREDRIRLDQGIMGAAARTRTTILANDVQRDPRYIAPPVPHPSRAEVAVPLLAGDQLLGVLNVEGDGPFDELDQLTLEAIGRHLALAIENARLVSEQQTNAILEERQRLAFELHDSVTQALSGISLLAQALPSAWQKGQADGLRASARVAELAQLAVAEMRTLLHELSAAERQNHNTRSRRAIAPVGLDRLKDGGLGAALPKLLGVLVPPHIRVECDFASYIPQSLEHEQALYRVFQEAASNLVRHSGASQMSLVAKVEPLLVRVSMRDNGRGMGSDKPDGYGFRSMRQRLEKLGGALGLRVLQPHGFEVLATLKRHDRAVTT